MLKKKINQKSYLNIIVYCLILIVSTLPLSQVAIRAQELPVSSPSELPISYPEEDTTVSEKPPVEIPINEYEGFSKEEVEDATAKVREALIVPAQDDFFVVKFKDEESANRVTQEVAPEDVVPERYTSLLGEDVRLIKIDNEEEKIDQMTRFNLDDAVEYVETNQIVKKEAWTVTSTTAKPNEFNNSNHWYHVKTKLPEAYKSQNCSAGTNCGGSSSVIVATLDTGMAFETNTGATYREYLGGSSYIDRSPLNFTTAPELNGINIWTNTSEDYGGGDEDGNFICDDLHGADMIAYVDNLSLLNASQWSDACTAGTSYVVKEGHPNDDDGHGSYVTGMIASLTDNGSSSFGAAFKTTIMPIKVLDYTGTGTTFTIAQGIRYAVNKGAKIINMSIAGLTTPSATLEDAISYANDADVLIVISSGNHGTTSSSLEYPAAYTNSYQNVIAVGASTNSDTRASYSNYGTGLDLVAPVGTGASTGNAAYAQTFADADGWTSTPLVSRNLTTYDNKFWIGTSFAAPQVTAAAATMISQNISYSPSLIKSILRGTAQDIGTGGYDNDTGYGILNIDAAQNATWSPWSQDAGQTPNNINSVVFNGVMYQAISNVNRNIFMRSTNDGSTWSPWIMQAGQTPGEINMVVFGGKLYQYIRNITRNIYSRNSVDGTTWTSWTVEQGMTPDDINTAVFGGVLYQVIRNVANNIYMRSSADATTWTGWVKQGEGLSDGQISIIAFSTKLYQVYKDVDRNIYMRNSSNGSSWSPWLLTNGMSPENVNMEVYNGKLYQVIRNIERYIYIRSSSDGTSWSNWILTPGQTPAEINLVTFNSVLYSYIRNVNRFIFYRYYLGS